MMKFFKKPQMDADERRLKSVILRERISPVYKYEWDILHYIQDNKRKISAFIRVHLRFFFLEGINHA